MALDNLASVVGIRNVISEPFDLEPYAGDMSQVQKMRPVCLIKPQSADEVQKIIKYAAETGTPLIPVSSGGPHFNGDTAPSSGGAVIVDLSGMKEIIHCDRKNRIVMFEPGVTFGELIPAVAEKGLRLNTPLIPRRSKSVVGSLLGREPVIMPKYHWDISDPLCCTEVVFGTGERFRTGSAAGPGSIEEQWTAGGAQKEGAGPASSSWYRLIQGAQGTMGIVTWATARCEILPKLEAPFFIGSNRLEPILDALHWLLRLGMLNECLVLNHTNLAMIMAGDDFEAFRWIRKELPAWILFINIAAYDFLPEERIRGQEEDMREVTQKMGLAAVASLSRVNAANFLAASKGPSPEPHWKIRYQGSCQDIYFISIYDKIPGLIRTMREVADNAGYPLSEMGIYLQPIVQGTSCHCEFNLFFDPSDTHQVAQIKELTAKAIPSLMGKGAFFSRPFGENARMMMNRDAASVMALKKIKSIVDPENILNPGKLCF